MVISLRPLRFDLDVDRNRLADSRHCFGCGGKHQIEVAPIDWVGRYRPARPTRVADRGQQLHMKGDRLRDAVHREIAKYVATLRAGPFHAAALECHLRKFLHVEELRTAQMIVTLFDSRVDAAHINLRGDRRILGVVTVDFDLAAEFHEFSMGGSEKLMHGETDRRTGRIELVGLTRRCGWTEARDYNHSNKTAQSHFELFFVSAASVFKSGVRESGSRPNRFPSAKAEL